jgi:hypothetical protein
MVPEADNPDISQPSYTHPQQFVLEPSVRTNEMAATSQRCPEKPPDRSRIVKGLVVMAKNRVPRKARYMVGRRSGPLPILCGNCSAVDPYQKIKPGITKTEVEAILGSPRKRDHVGITEVWTCVDLRQNWTVIFLVYFDKQGLVYFAQEKDRFSNSGW